MFFPEGDLLKELISKKGFYIVGAAVLVAVAAAVTVALSAGHAGFASLLSEPFFKPLRSVMTSLVDSLEHAYDYLYRYDEMEAENARLRARVAELEREYREYTEISEENERYRNLLGFAERHENMTMEPVTVLSWTASNYSSSFTVSKGSSAGIEVSDPVVDEYGNLVGQVTSVTGASCVVTTLVDTTTSLGALLYESGETGVASGDYTLFKDSKLKVSYINDMDGAVIGGTVVTSGSGGVYPSGIVIGAISGISVSSSGLDPYAVVEPATELSKLTHVFVITDFAVSE